MTDYWPRKKRRKSKWKPIEEEGKRQSQRAGFECDKAVLTTNKKPLKLAVAEAKLKAIEQSNEEEDDKATMVTIPGLDNPIDTQEITRARTKGDTWITQGIQAHITTQER